MTVDLENEIWEPIPSWENLYHVSNMGRVKSLAKIWYCGHRGDQPRIMDERLRKICFSGDGYGRVKLIGNHRRDTWLIHRLVATVFIPNTENKPEVNHKLGDKKDNRTTSLEWATASENGKHAFSIGLKRSKKLGESSSAKIVLNTQTGIYYLSAKEAWGSTNYKSYQTLTDKLCGSQYNDTSMIYV